jgi:endonuclease YncB( thermonuclease family)
MNKKILGIFTILIVATCSISYAINSYTNFSNVKYIRIIDGDTIVVNLPCSNPLLCEDMKIRIAKIDTPELKPRKIVNGKLISSLMRDCEKEEGQKAKNFVENLLSTSKMVELRNCKRGKYFRLVCEVLTDKGNVSQELLKNNLAYPYEGGRKQIINWCSYQYKG